MSLALLSICALAGCGGSSTASSSTKSAGQTLTTRTRSATTASAGRQTTKRAGGSPRAPVRGRAGSIHCQSQHVSTPTHIVGAQQLIEPIGHAKVTVKPVRVLRLPFLVDHFDNRTLMGKTLIAVVYEVRVRAGGGLKLAKDLNPDLLLVDHRGRAQRSLDAGTSCPAASSAFAADTKLTGFPESVLSKGFTGVSDVTFTAALTAGTYHLVSSSTRRSVALPRISLPQRSP